MVRYKHAIAGAAGAAAIFVIFVFLAQAHIILVPFFSPTILEIEGLRQNYRVGEKAGFLVRVDGYGSNCHMLQTEVLLDGERVSYYKKADDCRFMIITHGPYNFTKSFDYGSEVLGKEGTYKLDVQFEDLKDGNRASATRTFMVNPE